MDPSQHDTAQLQAQARDGIPEAQFQLAALHRKGAQGLERDPERAATLYMKAALQHHVEAQFQVAVAFKRGFGVVADSAEAAKWFAIAAGQGHARAQYQMGEAFAKGLGVPKDARESARWHHRAAEQGHHWSMYKLGEMHQEGVGVERSEAAALQWQDLSVEASDGSGRLHIARSKTDQEARGRVAYLTPDTAACLQRIKPTGARLEDRIFAMSARTIANRIKTAAVEGRFAGHSGRVGCAQDLAARGAGLTELQVAGRWQSAAMPALYARNQLTGRGAVAKYLT